MLKVLGRVTSINVRKVLWTCAELDLDFVHEPWGEADLPLRSPAFLALNPEGLVPVLIDGDVVLRESNTICRYLAMRERRHDLLPADPLGRARVEQWMDWAATSLFMAWRDAYMGLVRRRPEFDDPARIAASATAWNQQIELLDAHLAARPGANSGANSGADSGVNPGPWLLGQAFTLADIVLGLSLNRWLRTPIDHAAAPAVRAYELRLRGRPAYLRLGVEGAS